MNTQGTNLDFMAIEVRDMKRSREFYENQMGFTLAEYQNPQATVYKDCKGAIFAIKHPSGATDFDDNQGKGVAIWFGWNGSVEEQYQKLAEANASIVAPPFDTPFGKALTVADPDGYHITLHETD